LVTAVHYSCATLLLLLLLLLLLFTSLTVAQLLPQLLQPLAARADLLPVKHSPLCK
jgi:hypothetical protein